MSKAADIETQAASWLVRQDAGALTVAEQEEFVAWQHADPRHRAAYMRLEAAWKRADRLRELQGLVELKSPVDDLNGSIPDVQSTTPRRLWPWAIAAAASLLLVASVVLDAGRGEESWQSFSTGFGGFERVILPDGSAVELNAGSEIQVRLTGTRRQVTLQRGEANFHVAHDAIRPFDVRAGDTTLRAVGTSFAVLLLENMTVDVLVTEGRVAIEQLESSPPGRAGAIAPPTLGPGETATVSKSGATIKRVPPEGVQRRLAWTRGRLVFTGQTLAEAATQFNQYNRCKIVIGDPHVAELQVGGTFLATDPDSFVAALGRTLNVRVSNASESMSGSTCAPGEQLILIGGD